MATHGRKFLRRAAACALAAFGTAWLATGGAAPAQADDDIGKRAAERAREACRDLLRKQGFNDIDFGDMRSRDDKNRIIIEVDARRRGNDRQINCVYDRDNQKTFLDRNN